MMAIAASGPRAEAVCNQSVISTSDLAVWNLHGCWQDFFLWHYQVFDTRAGDWSNRGYFDACNNLLEYPKHWNAAYLMVYGLSDSLAGSFHGTVDYLEMSRGRDSAEWHAGFHHAATDNTGIFGSWDGSTVLTSCSLYDTTVVNGNPGSRGGDFVHEGTHAWMDHHGFDPAHLNNPSGGACTMTGAACDYFYFHGFGAYNFGELFQQDVTARRFHSPNQSQVEDLCDLADFPQPWVPASARNAATSDANARAVTRFINGPGFSCGSPRPW